MWVLLETAVIQLQSADDRVWHEWQRIFGRGFTTHTPPAATHICLSLTVTDALPPWPQNTVLFDAAPSQHSISVYDDTDCWWLHFHDGAIIQVPRQHKPEETAVVTGWLQPTALENGRLEDITYTALAPVLRRRGTFLVHAFAASRQNHSLLLVGATQSGKTTTGLWLLSQGWQLQANDVVMLTDRNPAVWAFSTPNLVGIRPPTLSLLPHWQSKLPDVDPKKFVELSSEELVNGRYAPAAPVTTICFLQRHSQPTSTIDPIPPSIALARLMTESIDRWDTPILPTHTAFLTRLAMQAQSYLLTVGNHPDTLAPLLPLLSPDRSNS